VTKQWTTKWLYIANAVFEIVQNYGEKFAFIGFKWAIAPPLGSALSRCFQCCFSFRLGRTQQKPDRAHAEKPAEEMRAVPHRLQKVNG